MTVASTLRSWPAEHDRLLLLMGNANWSVHMIAAQLDRPAYDIETRAEIFGFRLHDRTAGEKRCHQCNRLADEGCPYTYRSCVRQKVAK